MLIAAVKLKKTVIQVLERICNAATALLTVRTKDFIELVSKCNVYNTFNDAVQNNHISLLVSTSGKESQNSSKLKGNVPKLDKIEPDLFKVLLRIRGYLKKMQEQISERASQGSLNH